MPAKRLARLTAGLGSRALSESLLGHWAWAALMILAAAALALPQIDKYPMDVDAQKSFFFAGFTSEGSYDIQDVLYHSRQRNPDQLPLFDVLLFVWGRLAGHSLAVATLPAVFCGLLSLAMVYRLARDHVAPVAGTFAALILLSNAFYAFYYTQVRYYTLVVFLSALVIWLYLRIAHLRRSPRFRDYLALTLACLAAITTHAFGFLLYALLPAYHLLAVRKDRRWWLIAAAALVALLLASPLLIVLARDGISFAQSGHGPRRDDLAEILAAWLYVFGNGSPLLLALSAVGAALGWRMKLVRANPFWLLFPLLLLSIAAMSEATRVVSTGQMRYFLVGAPLVASFAASGLYALVRWRRWLALLALLWVMAGLHFLATADWNALIQVRYNSFREPPWHLVSRRMRQTGENLLVMEFDLQMDRLGQPRSGHKPLRDVYFRDHDLRIVSLSPEDIGDFARPREWRALSFWVLVQTLTSDAAAIAAIEAEMRSYDYEACQTTNFPNETVLVTYRWTGLDCVPPRLSDFYSTDIGVLAMAGADLDDAGEQLTVTGRWQPQRDFDYETHNLAFQLLDGDWRNWAQRDVMLRHEGQLRNFHIDVSAVPPGSYRLMAVVYNQATGDRYTWHDNDGWIPEMQPLAEVQISREPDA